MIRRSAGHRSFGLAPDHSFEDFDVEMRWLSSRLGEAGFGEVIVVDLTQSALAVPVVRVLVPGLEGSDRHPGYTAGPRARTAAQGRPS
jgi:ribosomal protein S12 methylthiotransferase accessory factor